MKFFTPELYVRGQSPDEAVQAEVDRLWEEANERYERRLREIEPDLPEHVRAANDVLLHDARVLSVARTGEQLVLVMRKDVPPRDLVIMTYDLLEDPVIDREALPPGDRSAVMDYLYDEFDLAREGERVFYTESILFSNGWEVRLRFRDVRVVLAEPLYDLSGLPGAPTPVGA